jgi:hypothetical protein
MIVNDQKKFKKKTDYDNMGKKPLELCNWIKNREKKLRSSQSKLA